MGLDIKKITSVIVYIFLAAAIVAIALVISKIVKKRQDSHLQKTPKTALIKQDKLGIATTITNIILSIIYIPLSLIGVFGAMMADNPPQHIFAKTLLYTGVFILIQTPVFCIASICTSVISRKKGKRLFGFLIQFAPFIIFAIAMAFVFLSDVTSF